MNEEYVIFYYGSGSAKAKGYGSYGSGSESTTLASSSCLQAVGAACQRLEYLNLGNIDLGAVLHLFLRSPAKAVLAIKKTTQKTHPRKPT